MIIKNKKRGEQSPQGSPIYCSIKCFIGDGIEHKRQIFLKFFNFVLMNLPANLDVLHVVRSRQENFRTFGHV